MAKNETVPAKGMQAGVGLASAIAAETLANVVNGKPAAKGVYIKNGDATDLIFVGLEEGASSSNRSYEIGPGEEAFFPIQDPWNLYIFASANTPGYTWYSV